jgi:hypothetical protein
MARKVSINHEYSFLESQNLLLVVELVVVGGIVPKYFVDK